MTTETTTQRKRREKSERVARVKALGIVAGDWVSRGRAIFRATPSMLDARNENFQFLRRATPNEIKIKESELEIQRQRTLDQEAYDAREDVKLARTINYTEVDDLLRLNVDDLREFAEKIKKLRV